MNRLGMIVDISHVSDKTFFDTVAVSTQPVIASHSSCRAISDIPRNMSDEMLRALARNGGVIGINFGGGFLHPDDAAGLKRVITNIASREPNLTGKALDDYAAKAWRREFRSRQAIHAGVADVVAHIDHVVKVAGIDHVGIGSDYDGIPSVPKGLEDVSKMPNLAAALLQRGYREEDVQKILGGNFLRVIRAVTGR
jgi:membrane dipeptidase